MKKINKWFGVLLTLSVISQWITLSAQGASFVLVSQQAATCTINELFLNLRSGPGTEFTILSQMGKGDVFNATERSEDGRWVFGESSNRKGWTSAKFITCASDITQLPVTTQSFSGGLADTTPITKTQTINTNGTILIQPTGSTLSGRVKFEWKTDVSLKKNQGYAVFFWTEGQDPLRQGFALAKATQTTFVELNLDKVALKLPKLLQYEGEYYWGVALVQIQPKRNLQLLKSSGKFVFIAPKAGGAAVLPPPPKPPK